MDDGEDSLPFLRIDADALQSLPRSAIRADERLVVCAGECRGFPVSLAAQRTHPDLSYIILHFRPPPCIYHIAGGGLHDVLHELRAIGIQPLPFLRRADAFIGDTFTAELVCTDLRLHIGKVPSGGQRDKQHPAPAGKGQPVAAGGVLTFFVSWKENALKEGIQGWWL